MDKKKGKKGSEKLFQVERIIKKRQVKKRVEYLVKWEGYSEKFNSWEPAVNFLNSDLIAQFEVRLKDTRESRSGRRRSPEIRRSKRLSGPRMTYATGEEEGDEELEEAIKRSKEGSSEPGPSTEDSAPSTPAPLSLPKTEESRSPNIFASMDIDNVLRSPLLPEEKPPKEEKSPPTVSPEPKEEVVEPPPDENEVPEESEEDLPAPPSLLPQVSESEAWIIEERKRLADEAKLTLPEDGKSADKFPLVVTDVAVGGASVVFRESPSGPLGFFANPNLYAAAKPRKSQLKRAIKSIPAKPLSPGVPSSPIAQSTAA